MQPIPFSENRNPPIPGRARPGGTGSVDTWPAHLYTLVDRWRTIYRTSCLRARVVGSPLCRLIPHLPPGRAYCVENWYYVCSNETAGRNNYNAFRDGHEESSATGAYDVWVIGLADNVAPSKLDPATKRANEINNANSSFFPIILPANVLYITPPAAARNDPIPPLDLQPSQPVKQVDEWVGKR